MFIMIVSPSRRRRGISSPPPEISIIGPTPTPADDIIYPPFIWPAIEVADAPPKTALTGNAEFLHRPGR
jgi:hypothetical protein